MYSGVQVCITQLCMCACMCTLAHVRCFTPFFVDWDLTMATMPSCRHEEDSLGLWRALLSHLRTCMLVALPLSLFNAGSFGYYLPALP